MIEELIEDFAGLEKVEAIVLGGSRAGQDFDESSDYDVYVYFSGEPVPPSVREGIIGKRASRMEIDNSFIECEDNAVLEDGSEVELLYRDLGGFEEELKEIVNDAKAKSGYSTTALHHLASSEVVFDKKNAFRDLRERYGKEYPEELKANIIARNMALLTGSLPAYDRQIETAAKRGDLVSLNHRVAAFLASYFDVIFALNGLPHPGKKRMVQKARSVCERIPENFEENISRLFSTMFSNPQKAPEVVSAMVTELERTLQEEES